MYESLPPPVKPTKSNEWYTPIEIIEAARRTLGSIDLDPASCELANETVKAARYFTKDDDGLSKVWQSRVWLNPPMSIEGASRGMEPGRTQPSTAKMWIDRLISEYETGNVSEAILLAKADPKQRWFQRLWEYLLCFSYGRVYFNRPGLSKETYQFGTVFVYLGPNEAAFIDNFKQFGAIARRIA